MAEIKPFTHCTDWEVFPKTRSSGETPTQGACPGGNLWGRERPWPLLPLTVLLGCQEAILPLTDRPQCAVQPEGTESLTL